MPNEGSPYFDVAEENGVAILYIFGPEIRHPTPAAECCADALKLLTNEGCQKLILNLGDVRYLSSTAFASLVNLGRKVSEAGGEVKISNLHPDVEVGAKIMGLGRIIPTFATETEALASFSNS